MSLLPAIEYQCKRVLTTKQISESFGADTKLVSYNFNHNLERYTEGKHYFVLSGKEKHEFLNRLEDHEGSKNAASLYLWTEKGAWLHAKSLNTDKAWEVYEELVDEYYRFKAQVQVSYMIEDPIKRAEKWIEEQRVRQRLESEKKQLEGEVEYKETVIIGLVDEIDLATKRQILNRVVRKGGANYQDRWRELYKQFEMKYHLNLSMRLDNYNTSHKPKLKNKIDYIDKILNKIPELYEIACKLYENDVKDLIAEIYELNNSTSIQLIPQ